jgi:hypothetical protein
MIYPKQNETKLEFTARCLSHYSDEGMNIDEIRIVSDLIFDNKDFAELDTAARDALPETAFVFPRERRYPIHDQAHAANALARSKGKTEEKAVWAAVRKKYPDLPAFNHADNQVYWIEVFKTGKHTATNGSEKEYTEDDLKAIVAKYNEQTDHEAPLVIGHPKENGPAFGWVDRLKMEGQKMLAGIKQLTKEVLEANRAGHYKKVSVSLYADGLLRHIGLLGANPPAVKGLAAVQFAADKEFSEWVWTTDEWRVPVIGRILQRVRDFMIEKLGLEVTDKLIPSREIETLTDTLTLQRNSVQQDEQFSEKEEEEMKDIVAKLQKEFEELTGKFNTMATNFAEQGKVLAATQTELTAEKEARAKDGLAFSESQKKLALETAKSGFEGFVEGLIASGQVLAAQKDGLMSEFADLYKADSVITYAEGAEKLVDRMKKRLSALPKTMQKTKVNFSENRAKSVDPGQIPANFAEFESISTTDLDIDTQATEYMKAHPGKTYAEAIDAIIQ